MDVKFILFFKIYVSKKLNLYVYFKKVCKFIFYLYMYKILVFYFSGFIVNYILRFIILLIMV